MTAFDAGSDARADTDERVLDEVVGGDRKDRERDELDRELQGEAVAAEEIEAEDDREGVREIDAVGVFGELVAGTDDPAGVELAEERQGEAKGQAENPRLALTRAVHEAEEQADKQQRQQPG